MTGPDVVVLSPHLDDAVLSLGALLARLAADGRRVEVWTAFSAGPDPQDVPRRWRAFADYPVRRAEDDRALDLLGARARRLDLREWIWRAPGGPGWLTAFRGPGDADHLASLPDLRRALEPVLSGRSAGGAPGGTGARVEVYAPLGVGQHADHVEVAVATLQAAEAAGALDRVAFYEDFYALGEAFRRQHPVTRGVPFPLRLSPGLAAPGLGAMLLTLAGLSASRRRSPRLDAYAPQVAALDWRCEAIDVGGFEQAKLRAVLEYTSQVSRLGGSRMLTAALRRSHRIRGGELLWRASTRTLSGA